MMNVPPMYASREDLDKMVLRLEAAMDKGFDRVGTNIEGISAMTEAHSVQLAVDAHRIHELEQKALRLEAHRWQLWGLVLAAASLVAAIVTKLIH